eukprot:4769873-Alexandrium_andersonii.AAC.1
MRKTLLGGVDLPGTADNCAALRNCTRLQAISGSFRQWRKAPEAAGSANNCRDCKQHLWAALGTPSPLKGT